MPSVIACPSCQKQLKVPDELIGRNVKCPGCKETFMAQAVGKSPPPEEIAEKPRKKPAPPPEEEEEDEVPRKPVKRRAADDDDEEEVEERPSKRVKRRGGGPMAPHRGVLILILGVGSLVGSVVVGFLAFFVGPVAWILANKDLKEMDAGRMDPEGRGQTQIGKVCGIISTVLLVLSIVALCLVVILWIFVIGVAVSNAPATFPRR